MLLSQQGLNLIQGEEKCSLTPYPDAGGYSIGWGHYIRPNEQNLMSGITQAMADSLLRLDTIWAVAAVNRLVTVGLNQNQFDALVSFVYNVGETQFRTSHLLTYLNQGDFASAAGEFAKWTHSNGGVTPALVSRRDDEQTLFEAPTGTA